MKKLLAIILFVLPVAAFAVQGAATYSKSDLTATLVVAQNSPGTLSYWNIANPNTGLVYVQFFDAAATTGITLGTTVPKFWIAVPPGNGVTDGTLVPGIAMQSGFVIAVTTTPTGNTAPSLTVPITLATN